MEKIEKIIITGKSGSGKDFLLRKLSKKGLKVSTKTTTRPKRQKEIQSIDYNFITKEEFNLLLNENKFICHQYFEVTNDSGEKETWFYGLTKEDFNRSQAFIMTPGEINQIPNEIRKDLFIVYLDIDRSIRENRIINRQDKNDSVKRRLDADEIDFKGFDDYDLKITDPEFDVDMVWDLMD